jgi:hypothetical protein
VNPAELPANLVQLLHAAAVARKRSRTAGARYATACYLGSETEAAKLDLDRQKASSAADALTTATLKALDLWGDLQPH